MNSPPYTNFITALAKKHESLKPLSRFLQSPHDTGAVPKVRIVDYKQEAAGQVAEPVVSFGGPWPNLGKLPPESQGRIILIENINAPLIESIGSQLHIEPSFFSTYLWVSPLDGVDELLATSRELLPSQLAKAPSNHIRYTRVVELKGSNIDLHRAKEAKTTSNIPRRVFSVPRMEGQPNLAIVTACHCSVTLAPNREGKPWICVILVDPSVSSIHAKFGDGNDQNIQCRDAQLLSDDLPTYSAFIRSGAEAIGDKPSMLSALLESIATKPYDMQLWAETILFLNYCPIMVVTAEWRNFHRLIYRYFKHYEEVVTAANDLDEKIAQDAKKWRSRSQQTYQKIKFVQRFLDYWISAASQPVRKEYAELLEDTNYLSAEMKELDASIGNTMQTVDSTVQLLINSRSVEEARNTKRLAVIALVFCPLSWVAGYLSMSQDYLPYGRLSSVYPAVAIPLVVAVVAITFLPYLSCPGVKDVPGYEFWSSRRRNQLREGLPTTFVKATNGDSVVR